MADWSDKQVSDPQEQEISVAEQTRRRVLGGIVGAVSLGVLGTNVTGASQSIPDPDGIDPSSPPWGTGWQPDVSPASEHCPPTTLDPEWVSNDLGTGVTGLTVRPDSNDPVYVSGGDPFDPTADGQIYALDRETGETLNGWPISVPGFPGVRPLKEDQTFYITYDTISSELILGSLDPVSGDEQWSRSFSGQSVGYGFIYDGDSDTIYLVLDGPVVKALDGTTGATDWSSEVGTDAGILATVRDGSTLYSFGNNTDQKGLLSAVDIESQGTEKWRVTGDTAASFVPAIGSDFVVMGFAPVGPQDDDTELVAIEKDTGNERWSKGRSDDLLYAGSARVDGDAVYATPGQNTDESPDSQGVVERLNAADGSVEYEVDVGGLVIGIQKDDQRVYTQTRPGDVIAIGDQPTGSEYGTESWREELSGDISDVTLTLECDTLYTGTDVDPGRLYAIDAENGDVLDSYTLDSGAVKTGYAIDGDVWATSGRPSDADPDSSIPREAYRFSGGGQPDTSVTVSMEPDSVDVGVDEETTVDLVIGGADDGVGSYEMSVGFEDEEVSSISDVSLAKGPESGVDIADDGSSATIDVDLETDPFEAGDNTVATVTLGGTNPGSTTFGFDSVSVTGSGGTEQQIAATDGCSVTVSGSEGPPPVGGGQPPQDLNGDGLYRDIDGDGELSSDDLILFYEEFRSDEVQENSQYFDFNQDGEVTLTDVYVLFLYILTQTDQELPVSEAELRSMSERELELLLRSL